MLTLLRHCSLAVCCQGVDCGSSTVLYHTQHYCTSQQQPLVNATGLKTIFCISSPCVYPCPAKPFVPLLALPATGPQGIGGGVLAPPSYCSTHSPLHMHSMNEWRRQQISLFLPFCKNSACVTNGLLFFQLLGQVETCFISTEQYHTDGCLTSVTKYMTNKITLIIGVNNNFLVSVLFNW